MPLCITWNQRLNVIFLTPLFCLFVLLITLTLAHLAICRVRYLLHHMSSICILFNILIFFCITVQPSWAICRDTHLEEEIQVCSNEVDPPRGRVIWGIEREIKYIFKGYIGLYSWADFSRIWNGNAVHLVWNNPSAFIICIYICIKTTARRA